MYSLAAIIEQFLNGQPVRAVKIFTVHGDKLALLML
jgi:hypothetical protein